MRAESGDFDVAVIGGGITGAAIAEKFSARGIRVGLFDSSSLGRETSASSHRIIHGGFRYLTKLDVARVRESVGNLDYCLAHFGDYVKPLPCFMALKAWGLKSRIPVQCAGFLYELLRSGFGSRFGGVRVISGAEIPRIMLPAPYGALRWVDGWLHDHGGVVQSLASRINAGGGSIHEHCKVIEIQSNQKYFNFRSVDEVFNARCIVTALGPWAVVGPLARFPNVPLARAYNVVLRRNLDEFADVDVYGVARESPSGRLFFLVPRVDGIAIGTGYLKVGRNDTFSEPPREEIKKFLDDSRGLFNWPDVSMDEVVRIEWGVLPVRAIGSGGPEFYGSSMIKESEPGRFDVLSTKYTSFESTAREVERLVMSRLGA
jgi:glycerol-3-phosphate dehydrogenase